MNDEKWGEILDLVAERFGVIEEGKENLEDVPNGTVEFVVFDSPLGRMRLERATKPRVIGTKTFGAGKHTLATGTELIYDPTETVKVFKAYKDQDGEWVPFDGAEGLF